MKTAPFIKLLAVVLAVLLSLAILYLVAVSPPEFLNINSVYKGF
jgi:hypothetical protein